MKSILDIILQNKKTRFDDFFNLDRKPDYPGITIHDLKSNMEKIIINLKYAKEYHKNDDDAIYDELSKINHYTLKTKKHISELETTIDEYGYAYEALVDLMSEIISKENIDLTKYSCNLTETEWKKLTRGKRIDDLLK